MLRKSSLDSVTREFKSVTTEKNSLASDFYFDTRDYFSVAMFFKIHNYKIHHNK